MKLQELFENRQEYLAQVFGDRLVNAARNDVSFRMQEPEMSPQTIIAELLKIDPSRGKALQFLVNKYIRQEFRLEDKERVFGALQQFFRLQKTLPIKDINQYKSIHDLYDVVEQPSEVPAEVSKRQMKKAVKQEGAEVVLKGNKFLALHVFTGEAACYYAAGTKWCTSNLETFKQYASTGDMYLIIVKTKTGVVRKFQFHYNSNQLMNEKDVPPTKAEIKLLSSFPEWYEFIDMMVKKHHKALES